MKHIKTLLQDGQHKTKNICVTEWDTSEVRDSPKDTVIGGNAQKESFMGWIIALLMPASIIDPFPA